MGTTQSLNVALVGCGAITELYYTPALQGLLKPEELRIAALVDPSATRRDLIGGHFPGAERFDSIEEMPQVGLDLAIVASPPKFHASQSITLMERGVHVLCEKPMAASLAEAEAMTAVARSSGCRLGIGLFRRFFPTSNYIHDLVTGGALGRPLSFEWMEGGAYNWPAASPSFFQKDSSPGGVMSDLGVHSLDLLIWWFGEPDSFLYEDDAHGGLEANCRMHLHFANGVEGSLRLSRDTAIPNHVFIAFERGWVRMDGVQATEISIGFNGVANVAKSQLHTLAGQNPASTDLRPSFTYAQSFMRQIQNLVRAIRGVEKVFISGEEGLRSLRWIEACYRERRKMPQPWL